MPLAYLSDPHVLYCIYSDSCPKDAGKGSCVLTSLTPLLDHELSEGRDLHTIHFCI